MARPELQPIRGQRTVARRSRDRTSEDRYQAAKALVGERSRRLRTDAAKLLGDVRVLVEAPTALRLRAKCEVERLLNEQARARLPTTPVAWLKGAVPRGIWLRIVQNSR